MSIESRGREDGPHASNPRDTVLPEVARLTIDRFTSNLRTLLEKTYPPGTPASMATQDIYLISRIHLALTLYDKLGSFDTEPYQLAGQVTPAMRAAIDDLNGQNTITSPSYRYDPESRRIVEEDVENGGRVFVWKKISSAE